MATIQFTVYGRPQQRGSKRAFTRKRKDGSTGVIVADDNAKSKDWMNQVRAAAAEAYRGPLLTGPILLQAAFRFKRPASHFGSGRNASTLKPSAPREHTQTPDLSKLIRALEDGITGVVWHDDRQVSECLSSKSWTTEAEFVHVIIDEMAP